MSNAWKYRVVVLDCDKGDDPQEIIRKCTENDVAAVIVSSHSNGKTRSKFSHTEYESWANKTDAANAEAFLIHKGFSEEVARGAEIVDQQNNITGHSEVAKIIAIDHAPCHKLRVILFARKPWNVADYASAGEAHEAYRQGLNDAAKMLDVTHDESATDVARVFFNPRHSEGANFISLFVAGSSFDAWPKVCAVMSDNNEDEELLQLVVSNLKLSFQELESAVLAIKNDERFNERKDWIKILVGIKGETDGSEEGFALADQWSKSWTTGFYDPEETRKVWETLDVSRKIGAATVDSIIHYAKQDGWHPSIKDQEAHLAPHGDIWNGRAFARKYRGKLLHVHSTDEWLRWSGIRWAAIPGNSIDA